MKGMKKEAKKKMLQKLKGVMSDDMHEGMGEKMKGMQKVTVASDSKQGLKKGLSKAQEILQKRKGDDEYACGGKEKDYQDGGVSPREAGEKGVLTDQDVERYKAGKSDKKLSKREMAAELGKITDNDLKRYESKKKDPFAKMKKKLKR